MKITPDLFEAFLKCPTKCWLRVVGEPTSGNAYAEWVQAQNESYRAEAAKRLTADLPADECASPGSGRREAHYSAETLKTAKWRFALDVPARTELGSSRGPQFAERTSPDGQQLGGGFGKPNETQMSPPENSHSLTSAATIETCLHAVERIPSAGRGQPAQFVPIRFIYRNKLTKDDKLLLAFDAFVLSEMLGRAVSLGKIIHGDDHATLKVKTPALAGEVRKRLAKITALLANPAPPDLVLNRHCAECEFQARCRKLAVEKDDLSLLAGMSAKERQKLRSKGIFTVMQLSYTFRPRRTPKHAKNPAKPRYLALQALAIRENTIYFHGTPTLPQSITQVYLDIEGLPDRAFYYLIGILVVTDGHETFQSFWADTQADEPTIFVQFAETVGQLENFRVFHFGDYDTAALKHMKARLSEAHQKQLDAILGKCTNILSALYPHVYFPIYSNNLKDIGRFIAADCPTNDTTGLHSIIWRSEWEAKREIDLKATLIEYNRTDCELLKCLSVFMVRQMTGENPPEVGVKICHTQEVFKDRPYWQLFRPREYAVKDLEQINKCAYFDYQREKVLVRTHRHFKVINKQHRKLRRTNVRPNETIRIELKRCPKCGSRKIQVLKELSQLVVDLKFTRTGVKKWVKETCGCRYRCLKCKSRVSSLDRFPNPQRRGHGLASWAIYLNIGCGLNMSRVGKSLGEVFKIYLDHDALYRERDYLVQEYEKLYSEILTGILSGRVIHIDETTVHLRKSGTGYVWVLTSMDKVYYLYRPTREGAFLEEILASFSGVLVSDFYTAYDSVPCEQQKCLAHLVRDIDDDLLKNPLDSEFKTIATEFGSLLKAIVQTVDRYGLKKRHLHKHKREARRFLDSVASRKLVSELAVKYQKRFQKSGSKMFTFLDHDGVPWNNNNAEHAIKRFAKHRRDANGKFTEASLREYLVLASVLETCEFNNVSVLDFLLSKETTLSGLFRMAGRKIEPAQVISSAQSDPLVNLPPDAIPPSGSQSAQQPT